LISFSKDWIKRFFHLNRELSYTHRIGHNQLKAL
jgi:hypothetical protein